MSQKKLPAATAASLLGAAGALLQLNPIAAQQADYALTYTEVRQTSVLVPALADGEPLSPLERALTLQPSADTLRVTTGYSRVAGLYDETVVLNPDRREREAWQSPLPTHHRIDAEGSTVRDATGRLVVHHPPTERDRAERQALEALAASGRLTPFVRAIIPTSEEIDGLRAQGYRVEVTEAQLVGRAAAGGGGGDLDIGPAASLLTGTRGADARVLTAERPGERVVADAANGTLATTTYADAANTHAVAIRVSFLVPADAIGGEGYVEALLLELRADTLATGRRVSRRLISRRSDHHYTGPGDADLRSSASPDEPFGSLVNPLSPGELLVAVPEAFRRGGGVLTLVDAQGRLYAQRDLRPGDDSTVALTLPPDAPAGPYVLSVDDGTRRRQQVVVVQ